MDKFSYGSFTQTRLKSKLDSIVENININGYHIEENIINNDLCKELKHKILLFLYYKSLNQFETFKRN